MDKHYSCSSAVCTEENNRFSSYASSFSPSTTNRCRRLRINLSLPRNYNSNNNNNNNTQERRSITTHETGSEWTTPKSTPFTTFSHVEQLQTHQQQEPEQRRPVKVVRIKTTPSKPRLVTINVSSSSSNNNQFSNATHFSPIQNDYYHDSQQYDYEQQYSQATQNYDSSIIDHRSVLQPLWTVAGRDAVGMTSAGFGQTSTFLSSNQFEKPSPESSYSDFVYSPTKTFSSLNSSDSFKSFGNQLNNYQVHKEMPLFDLSEKYDNLSPYKYESWSPKYEPYIHKSSTRTSTRSFSPVIETKIIDSASSVLKRGWRILGNSNIGNQNNALEEILRIAENIINTSPQQNASSSIVVNVGGSHTWPVTGQMQSFSSRRQDFEVKSLSNSSSSSSSRASPGLKTSTTGATTFPWRTIKIETINREKPTTNSLKWY